MENSAMGTRNPRVSGYISPELFVLVERYLSENSCSQSDLVHQAVNAFLAVGISSAALSEDARSKLETLAAESFRSPEDQGRFLLQTAINKAWSERQTNA